MIRPTFTPYLAIRQTTKETYDSWSMLLLPMVHSLACTTNHQNLVENVSEALAIEILGSVAQLLQHLSG